MVVPERANNGEEARKLRTILGTGKLADSNMKKWLKYVKVEGNEWTAYALPMVTRKADPKEKARKEAERKVDVERRAKERAEKRAKKDKDKQAKRQAYLKKLEESTKRKEKELEEKKKRLKEKLLKLEK